jgi:hypothetical protein
MHLAGEVGKVGKLQFYVGEVVAGVLLLVGQLEVHGGEVLGEGGGVGVQLGEGRS